MRKQNLRFFALGMLFVTISLSVYLLAFDNGEEKSRSKKADSSGNISALEQKLIEQNEKIAQLEKDNKQLKADNSTFQTELKKYKNQQGNPTPMTEPIIFEIQRGMTLEEISRQLSNVRIIDDAKSFQYYMIDSGLDRQIQIGSYSLIKGMTMEEIGEIITKKRGD